MEPRYAINGKTARQRVIEIIQESGADVITMTETYGSAKAIASALGYYYYTPEPDANLTIFSRYPLDEPTIHSSLSFMMEHGNTARASLPT